MSMWTHCTITFYPERQRQQFISTGFSPLRYFKEACDAWDGRVIVQEADGKLHITISDSLEVDYVAPKIRKILEQIPKQLSYSVWIEGQM